MAITLLGLGTAANDGTGDNLRAGGQKLNAMFQELYDRSEALSINVQSGTAYTFVAADALSKMVKATSASAATFTIPTNAQVPYKAGSTITLMQEGAGAVTVAAASGVTLRNAAGYVPTTSGQYVVLTLFKDATDTWTVFGALKVA